MSEQDEALRWAEYFCGVMRFVLALAPHMDDAEYWRGWLYAVDQDRLLYRLHNDARELLSDYRFWREHDPQGVALALGAARFDVRRN